MARYRLHMDSYLQSEDDPIAVVHKEGSEIEVSPEVPPGPHWEALDDEAREAVAFFQKNPPKSRDMNGEPMFQFKTAPKVEERTKRKYVRRTESAEQPAA